MPLLAGEIFSQTKPIHHVARFRAAPESPEVLSSVFPPAGTHGSLRFAQVPGGVWIAGEPPAAIALPASQLAPIPQPGLYTRFGRSELCQDTRGKCVDWIRRSERRRALLRQLVSRRFELRGQKYVETRSTQAARGLDPGDQALIPQGVPEVHTFGRMYGVMIPWNALPPRSDLALGRFRFRWPSLASRR